MTTLKLVFVAETTLARLYRDAKGVEKWVPRSVIKRCLRPDITGPGDTHEVGIEDWWLRENPWVAKAQKQDELL